MKNLIKAEKAIDILVFFYYLSWWTRILCTSITLKKKDMLHIALVKACQVQIRLKMNRKLRTA